MALPFFPCFHVEYAAFLELVAFDDELCYGRQLPQLSIEQCPDFGNHTYATVLIFCFGISRVVLRKLVVTLVLSIWRDRPGCVDSILNIYVTGSFDTNYFRRSTDQSLEFSLASLS